jgi:hypothetical protein
MVTCICSATNELENQLDRENCIKMRNPLERTYPFLLDVTTDIACRQNVLSFVLLSDSLRLDMSISSERFLSVASEFRPY